MPTHQNTWRACVYISLQCWYWLLLGLLLRFMLLDSWVHISAQHMWWWICQWRSVGKLASFHIYNSAAIVENHLLTNLSGDWLYTTMGHWRLSCIIENARLGLCKIGYVILWHILHVTLGCSVNFWFLRSIIHATIGEGLQLSQGKDD